VTHLLDVNALLALGLRRHQFHDRVAAWLIAEADPTLATCSITELGFLRIASQSAAYGLTVPSALDTLISLKASSVFPFIFLADTQDVTHLPAWVATPRQTTDGHLLQLAASHGATLATLDANIPGAFLIP
jgi:predicted nucleic acid-binding protein